MGHLLEHSWATGPPSGWLTRHPIACPPPTPLGLPAHLLSPSPRRLSQLHPSGSSASGAAPGDRGGARRRACGVPAGLGKAHTHCASGPVTPPLLSGVIEKRDSQPLLDILEVMGGWPVTMEKWNESVGKARAWRRPRPAHRPTPPGAPAAEPSRLLLASVYQRLVGPLPEP